MKRSTKHQAISSMKEGPILDDVFDLDALFETSAVESQVCKRRKRSSCGCSRNHSYTSTNINSSTKPIALNGFSNIASVFHVVLKFLNTPGLVAVSGCSKTCEALVQEEVSRRKGRIIKLNRRVKELLGSRIIENENETKENQDKNKIQKKSLSIIVPTRKDVFEANSLCQEAKLIVDDGFDTSYNYINNKNHRNSLCNRRPKDKFFEEERALLRSTSDLNMLPLCFYLPLSGGEASQQLQQDQREKAFRGIELLWEIEDIIQEAYEVFAIDFILRDDYETYFNFYLPTSLAFAKYIRTVASIFASSPSDLDALRLEGRRFVLRIPNAQDFIHYLIRIAECMSVDFSGNDTGGANDRGIHDRRRMSDNLIPTVERNTITGAFS